MASASGDSCVHPPLPDPKSVARKLKPVFERMPLNGKFADDKFDQRWVFMEQVQFWSPVPQDLIGSNYAILHIFLSTV